MTSSPGSQIAATPKKRNHLAPGETSTRPASMEMPRDRVR
jgi:hypothetical protein